MLDACGIGSGAKKFQKAAADELGAHQTQQKDERTALSEMLMQVTMRATKLTQTRKLLEQVEKTAAGA